MGAGHDAKRRPEIHEDELNRRPLVVEIANECELLLVCRCGDDEQRVLYRGMRRLAQPVARDVIEVCRERDHDFGVEPRLEQSIRAYVHDLFAQLQRKRHERRRAVDDCRCAPCDLRGDRVVADRPIWRPGRESRLRCENAPECLADAPLWQAAVVVRLDERRENLATLFRVPEGQHHVGSGQDRVERKGAGSAGPA